MLKVVSFKVARITKNTLHFFRVKTDPSVQTFAEQPVAEPGSPGIRVNNTFM